MLGQVHTLFAALNNQPVNVIQSVIPTVESAITALNTASDRRLISPAQRETLLKTLNTLSSSPSSSPEVQTRVKEAIAKLNTELETLRRQVQSRAKLLQQGDAKAKAEAEAQGKVILEQRTKVTGALDAVQQARPSGDHPEILRTIRNNLNNAVTPEQITTVMSGMEKQAQEISKALNTLASEVGPGYPPSAVNAAVQRRTGTIIVGVHRAVDALYRNERSAKFLRETLGMTPEDLKDTVTGWLAELFEGIRGSDMGPLGRSLEGTTRGVAEEIRFRQALTNYRGNPADVTDVWRQDWSKRYRAWLAQPAQSRGPFPPIQNPETSAKQEQAEKAEKDKKAQEAKAKEDEQKAQKDAATDLATTRRIEETDIPGNGLLIPTAPTVITINIPGNRTAFFQRSAGGDFRMRVENGAVHDNWITIRTASMRPNAARLCAPVGTQSLADLRLVTQTPDGRPAFWKRTAPLTIRSIVEQIEKRGVQSPLTLVLADDNSSARLLSPEEMKKEAESKSKVEAQAKGKAELLVKTAAEQLLKQFGALEGVIKGLPEAQRKLAATQALLKQAPDLMRIVRTCATTGERPGIMDSLTLLQAYANLRAVTGPSIDPIQKAVLQFIQQNEIVSTAQQTVKGIGDVLNRFNPF